MVEKGDKGYTNRQKSLDNYDAEVRLIEMKREGKVVCSIHLEITFQNFRKQFSFLLCYHAKISHPNMVPEARFMDYVISVVYCNITCMFVI